MILSGNIIRIKRETSSPFTEGKKINFSIDELNIPKNKLNKSLK